MDFPDFFETKEMYKKILKKHPETFKSLRPPNVKYPRRWRRLAWLVAKLEVLRERFPRHSTKTLYKFLRFLQRLPEKVLVELLGRE